MNTFWKGLPFTFPRFSQFAVGWACAAKCIGCDSVGEVFWWCCGYWSHPGELRICSKWQLHSTLTISLHLVGYWKWWVLPLKGGMFSRIRDIFGCHVIFMRIYKYPENPVASWTEHDPHSPHQTKECTDFPLPCWRWGRVKLQHFPSDFKTGLEFGEEGEILTSLDGVKELGVVSNNALDQRPPPHTRGTNQHLQPLRHCFLS